MVGSKKTRSAIKSCSNPKAASMHAEQTDRISMVAIRSLSSNRDRFFSPGQSVTTPALLINPPASNDVEP